jgi:VanZ family protein
VAERLFATSFWVALAICTYMAFAPSPPQTVFRISDIALHGFAFVVLSFLLSVSYFNQTLVKPALWMLAYGVLIEVVQSQIPQRSPEVKDLLVDAVGIFIGLGLVRLCGPWTMGVAKRLLG